MRPEDMTVGELEIERDRLQRERDDLQKYSQVDDLDDDWGQNTRELDIVNRLLVRRRRA